MCVSFCGGMEEEMEVFSQFSSANKLSNVACPSKAAANVWCCSLVRQTMRERSRCANLKENHLLLNFSKCQRQIYNPHCIELMYRACFCLCGLCRCGFCSESWQKFIHRINILFIIRRGGWGCLHGFSCCIQACLLTPGVQLNNIS